jgi:hypothetical protein
MSLQQNQQKGHKSDLLVEFCDGNEHLLNVCVFIGMPVDHIIGAYESWLRRKTHGDFKAFLSFVDCSASRSSIN